MKTRVGLSAALGSLVTVWVFYPGYMSVDSLVQLGQARSGQYSDLHPPVMAMLLRLFDHFWPGPQGYVAFQILLFWGALAFLISALAPPKWAPVLVLSVGFAPSIFAMLGTLWKDVLLGELLLAATALLWRSRRAHDRRSMIAALFVLFVATTTRHNALAAVAPLFVWLSLELLHAQNVQKHRQLLALALGTLLTFCSWAASHQLSLALTGGKSTHSEQQIMIFDIAGVSTARDVDLLPDYFRENPAYSFAQVKAGYHPENVCGVVYCPGAPCPMTDDPQKLLELRHSWFSVIRNHHRDWLQHRSTVYRHLLSFETPTVEYPYHRGVDPNSLGVEFHPSAINDIAMEALESVRNTWVFRGWVYVVLLALFVGLSLHRAFARVRALLLVTSLSGLGYALAYFFVAPVSDFRLLWWSVVAAWLCIVALVAEGLQRAAASEAGRRDREHQRTARIRDVILRERHAGRGDGLGGIRQCNLLDGAEPRVDTLGVT